MDLFTFRLWRQHLPLPGHRPVLDGAARGQRAAPAQAGRRRRGPVAPGHRRRRLGHPVAHANLAPEAVEFRVEVARPLGEAQDLAEPRIAGDAEVDVLVLEAPGIRHAARADAVEGLRQRAQRRRHVPAVGPVAPVAPIANSMAFTT